MNQELKDIIIEEYKNVTKEISTIMSEIFELEKYSVVVLGAIYVFLFNDMCGTVPEKIINIILVLPLITTLIFGVLIFSRFRRVKLLAKYIKSRYEPSFGSMGETKLGYETFLANELKDSNSAIFISRLISWLIQIIFAIIVLIVVECPNT